MEIWKDIDGYEGIYQISTVGRVKRLERKARSGRKVSERIKKSVNDSNGYKNVTLSKDGINKQVLVHRLVAQAFIPNTNNKETVNHKNGIKDDNRLENLEWSTYSENLKHAVREGLRTPLRGTEHPRYGKVGKLSKLSKRVICVTTGEVFESIREAGRKTDVSASYIGSCCKGKVYSAGKHPITKEKLIWKYID